MKSKWTKSFIIMVLMICLMVAPCYAAIMPQAVVTVESETKTVSNPSASSNYNLIYSLNTYPYSVYRVGGSFRGNGNSTTTIYWQFRDSDGNVIHSFTSNAADFRTFDKSFASTPFSGLYIYAKTSNTSVSSASFYCNDMTIYYGSDIAEQSDLEATLTAANTAATNATNAYTEANTAASRALNNYNILNNTTKGLYKTYDVANVAATNTSYGGNTAAYLAYLASEDASYVRDTLIPNIQTDIDNLTTTVNTINSTITDDSVAPTIISLRGLNGATCTTNGIYCSCFSFRQLFWATAGPG
ncbi:hypothetical protein ACOBQJ_03275 [Pelotomaculum propionicicum]|uniref:hypothetical protein n=1 Tax=Pelotomaculum propionicicum TaxID=258475 RepID=UPI003B7D1F15